MVMHRVLLSLRPKGYKMLYLGSPFTTCYDACFALAYKRYGCSLLNSIQFLTEHFARPPKGTV